MGLKFDDTDFAIIDLIKRDGRMSNREIARQLEISEGTVRTRLKRLHETRALRIGVVTDPRAVGLTTNAYIGIGTEPGTARQVASTINAMEEFALASMTLGRFDVFGFAVVKDRAALLDLVSNRLRAIPGIRTVETIEAQMIYKHDVNWALLK